MRNIPRLLLVSVLLAVAGCTVLKQKPSSEDFYSQGEATFQQADYNAAIDNYQHVIDQFPFSPYAEDAELKIALSLYQQHKYPEAISAFSDFQRMHPTNKDLPLASYYLGMAYFDQIHRPDQDQSNTANALAQFQALERRFPESEFARLAQDRIEICRETLARNEEIIGEFYYQRAQFRAAESRLAELMQKYPDTPIAPGALYELAVTLEKEGKKYSAAQAFAAVQRHFPDSKYAANASRELKELNQPIDNEEDPLRLVLAESGFNPDETASQSRVIVRQAANAAPSEPQQDSSTYGPDGLPILPSAQPKPAPAPVALAGREVTLRSIRLASSDPPLSVIFDMSGPVKFEKHLESGPGSSSLTLRLLNTKPDSRLEAHLVFDRSIFKDCDVKSDSGDTTVTVKTAEVSHFAIIPLEDPPRLLVTFTPTSHELGESTVTSGL
ncbi:MAG: outer membrane protein assembly factor BamD [Candidatus Binataceae bacterium]|jgi:outer membrane protein assembly factor BamD